MSSQFLGGVILVDLEQGMIIYTLKKIGIKKNFKWLEYFCWWCLRYYKGDSNTHPGLRTTVISVARFLGERKKNERCTSTRIYEKLRRNGVKVQDFFNGVFFEGNQWETLFILLN